jgi:hypothetical protein
MMNISSHAQASRYGRFYFHPEGHVGSGGTSDAHPTNPPAPDRATTPEDATGTATPSGSPAPDGNAESTKAN